MRAHRRIFRHKAGKESWSEAWWFGGGDGVVGDGVVSGGGVSDGGESLICCEGEARDERTEADVVFPAYSVPAGDYFIMGQQVLSRLTPPPHYERGICPDVKRLTACSQRPL